jgi:hypothetical protein
VFGRGGEEERGIIIIIDNNDGNDSDSDSDSDRDRDNDNDNVDGTGEAQERGGAARVPEALLVAQQRVDLAIRFLLARARALLCPRQERNLQIYPLFEPRRSRS